MVSIQFASTLHHELNYPDPVFVLIDRAALAATPARCTSANLPLSTFTAESPIGLPRFRPTAWLPLPANRH